MGENALSSQLCTPRADSKVLRPCPTPALSWISRFHLSWRALGELSCSTPSTPCDIEGELSADKGRWEAYLG